MSTEYGYTWYCKLPACSIEYEAWWLVRCTQSSQNFFEVNNNLPIWAIQPSFISMTTSALLRYFVWWVQRILVLFFNNPIIHLVYRCLATCVSTADNGSSRRYTDLSWKLYHNQVKAVSFTKWSQNEGLLWYKVVVYKLDGQNEGLLWFDISQLPMYSVSITITSRYRWNTAQVGIKDQSDYQSLM
jgi:hypothetical protein